MMTNNEEAWDPRDNNRNDFDDTADSFAGQNEDAFANGDLDDDELKDDDGDYDNDLKPTYSQDDLDDDDEDNGPIELPDEGNDNEIPEEGESENEGTQNIADNPR